MFRLFFFALLVSSTANAQYILERFESPTHQIRYQDPLLLPKAAPRFTPVDSNELEKRARDLAKVLVAQFESVLEPAQFKPDCANPKELAKYVKALKLSGRAKEALEAGEKCISVQTTETAAKLELLSEIAQTAVADFKFKRALEIYEIATGKEFVFLLEHMLTVLEYANFAMRTEYQAKVPEILGRAFEKEKARLAQAALEIFFLGSSPLAKESETDPFVGDLVKNGTARTRSFFHLFKIHHLDRNRYLYNEMLKYLEENVNEILDPSEWVDNAYSGFYHQNGPEEYRTAQIIYDAYNKYAHKFSWLPVETNTQNYSELYWETCKDSLLQGNEYNRLHVLRYQYLLGVNGLQQSIKAVTELETEIPGKADAIDFFAHLYTRKNEDDVASQKYFDSHKACSYYNRSHWGLTNIVRRKRHKAFSDYQSLLEKMKSEVEKLPPMDGLENYILSWEGLDDEAKFRLKYSLRFWANHIKYLSSTKQKIYIKRGFELISFVPYMSHMRDLRVTYEGDNRLWDDIRGLGGPIVIVDLEEMMDGPFGVYNLAGHEVAHQFDRTLPASLGECIDKLYEAAKKRGVFADPYSGFNSAEYFAQGVGYYMWAPGTPKRFGLNRQWLLDNDRDLDKFLDSVFKARGVSEISCPI